jgi:RNA polymerase sigma-54 factor
VLRVIQALEPSVVGARDLRECLLIQLEAKAEGHAVVAHDPRQFDNLVNRRFPRSRASSSARSRRSRRAADVDRDAESAPGLEVSAEDPKYVVPDLLVERVDDDYVVLLNDRHLPRLRISSAYERCAADKKKSDVNADERRPASTSRASSTRRAG